MPGLLSIIGWFSVIAFLRVALICCRNRQILGSSPFSGSLLLLFLFVFPAELSSHLPVSESHVSDEIDDLLALEDDDLLEAIQERTFKYFWDFAHPNSGMARERNTSGDLVTTGGSGFGVMAILVGIHRGFISRSAGLERVTGIVSFLSQADRFHGVWPHWMNGITGKVIPFSPRDNGGDLVETTFMLQGLLTARAFFSARETVEEQLRTQITDLWESVEWNWYRKQVQQTLFWHWSPEFGFDINLPIRGWNETMISYILGIASPTHPLPASTYARGWAGSDYLNGQTFYGFKLPLGPQTGGPLFFTHYSFLGLDPRGLKDDFANYFFQGQNQTLINRAYCMENPEGHLGYGPDCWGLTASDDPDGYRAHAPNRQADNGTITPSAAISSIVYTPEESIAAIRHMLGTYRERVWGSMGFYDAFNPSRDWYADSYLAIDQGPILIMIENYRSGLLWDHFMRDDAIQVALDGIGFVADSSATSTAENHLQPVLIYPNPASQHLYVQLEKSGKVPFQIMLKNLQGSLLKQWKFRAELGGKKLMLPQRLAPGVYILEAKEGNRESSQRIIITD